MPMPYGRELHEIGGRRRGSWICSPPVSGFMFPRDDGERSWIKERLALTHPASFSYVYRLEASNVGLDGSVNSLQLVHYGEESTLVDWSFELDPVQGAQEETIIDYLAFLYKSCIYRIEGAIDRASKKEQEPWT
ncbi:uncharacterized protein LOC103704179 [Phoenix dactylifera]|uniref:Uncharacterized protein LOC103704179 n=1 Tax=Phoenix dactylifera TaxID=42345 RepID=A0A8B8J365_PHODC|nr:uncharacterized protein LOC103704179 [Phoenix dactylifera]